MDLLALSPEMTVSGIVLARLGRIFISTVRLGNVLHAKPFHMNQIVLRRSIVHPKDL